jgi:zinc-ribbon domain
LTVITRMFCTRCGKENRDDASFCTLCGASLTQTPAVPVVVSPPRPAKAWWIAGTVLAVIVIVSIAASITAHALIVNRNSQSGHVIVDGKTVVGANGKPIELVRNSEATDVTWADLKQFLSTDNTDRILYNESTFMCGDFAERLFNNAEAAGIRAGFVVIEFGPGTTGHACNAFETTDRGVVYVDDTGTISGSVNADKTVNIQIGKSYCPASIFSYPGQHFTWECMGAVSDFQVVW